LIVCDALDSSVDAPITPCFEGSQPHCSSRTGLSWTARLGFNFLLS
jgi:hypothetical protein